MPAVNEAAELGLDDTDHLFHLHGARFLGSRELVTLENGAQVRLDVRVRVKG